MFGSLRSSVSVEPEGQEDYVADLEAEVRALHREKAELSRQLARAHACMADEWEGDIQLEDVSIIASGPRDESMVDEMELSRSVRYQCAKLML